jgi:hypothetical protein
MNSARICAAALAIALSMPGAAHANLSTMEMMERCKPVANAVIYDDRAVRMATTFESGTCFGAFMSLGAIGSYFSACLPAEFNVVQMARIFDVYARQHPEIQHQEFELTAMSALRSAFPCK